jgi:hypothetical protein
MASRPDLSFKTSVIGSLCLHPSQLIADSDSRESARKAFAQLSQEAIRLPDRHPEYLILRCPTDCPEKCTNCRSNEFGSWVQIDAAVGNPSMGCCDAF